MKRGLKASTETKLCDLSSSYNHYPDEKGTESICKAFCLIISEYSYNHYPDEKGTESIITNRSCNS